jgi:hypothetical protein
MLYNQSKLSMNGIPVPSMDLTGYGGDYTSTQMELTVELERLREKLKSYCLRCMCVAI